LFQLLPPSLPAVHKVRNGGPLLKPGPLALQQDVMSLDYVHGCGHGCPFCVARLGADGLGGGQVGLADKAAERLSDELHDLPRPPHAVFVSPSTDPFPPLQEIQYETGRLVEVLARHGIEAWLMTRGFIRPAVLEDLSRHAAQVKVTVAMTTVDRQLQRLLEPLTAPPRLRLKTVHNLREAGIACNAALEPLIPGVTDTRQNLQPLLEALANAGIRHVTVGYLVLHQRNELHLQSILRPHGLDTMVMEEYARGLNLRHGQGIAGRYLPRARRQHGYAALMSMAAGLGLRVTINALTNPDFAAGRQSEAPRQMQAGLQVRVHAN
jgi:DNA repair photolyase